jgi:TonB family protein
MVKLYQTYKELSIYLIIIKQRKLLVGNVFIKYTDIIDQPFSFFNTIVLPQELEQDSKNKAIIIAHEYTHIRYKHYYDLIFMKVLEILFPYHPCLYFFKKELLLIHEYQADQVAVKHSNAEDYSTILMQFAKKVSLNGSMIHTFYFSPIKSRITMLFKQTTKLHYFLLAFVPILFSACIFINQDFETEFPVTLPNIIKSDTTIIYSDLAMGYNDFLLPFFPGGDKGLMEFLGTNIKYPKRGRMNGIQGTSYVKFVVYEDGSIHNKTILRSLGEEFDKELFRVIDLMPKWIPAEKDGMKLRKEYTLPVKFKLTD